MTASNRRPAGRSRSLLLKFGALAALALLFPSVALAAQLLVNGVPIGKVDLTVKGIENMVFDKCAQVKIEPNGDVKIDCPGYDLQAATTAAAQQAVAAREPPPPSALGKINKQYWLVVSQTQAGLTQFDIDLYVNKKWIRRFRNSDASAVLELTKELAPGDNSIIFAATKSAEARKSTSPDATFKFLIGEGHVVGANLSLDRKVLEYQKTAADADSATDERTITAE